MRRGTGSWLCRSFLYFLLLSTISFPLSTPAQGTAFTYQGRLNDSNGPVTGIYDLRLTLYDQLGGPSSPFFVLAVPITNGLFTVTTDFGNLFNGDNRSLEIAARPFNTGAYVTLNPRQPLTPTPYAIFANTASNLSGILPASQLTGTIANGNLPSSPNFSGTVTASSFSGNGANITSVNANNISGGTLPDARLSSNVALRAGGNTFTNTQTFNGPIILNTSAGFDPSAIGNFYIDAPFQQGGRLAVLENGDVGIGIPSPSQKFQVNGAAMVNALTVNGAVNLPTAATINGGTDPVLRSDAANQNIFAGSGAGKNSTNINNNTALGYQAFYQGTNSQFNTAIGDLALHSTKSGSFNTAVGALALYSNTSGGPNTAVGYQALYSSAGSVNNTAVGHQALYSNLSGNWNTAYGNQALYSLASGEFNTASGYQALYLSKSGDDNVAYGFQALYHSTNGYNNVAIGYDALSSSASGGYNIAIGSSAGGNIVLGSDNIHIGTSGDFDENDSIRIGRSQTSTFIAGIYHAILPNWTPVYVSSDGQLGTIASSARFKQNIQDMGDASDVLLALQPVTFQYKPDIDPQGRSQFGLIAEEVEKIDPDLVVHDNEHGIYTVRYDAVNAMLLNEFLKQHGKVEEQRVEMQALNHKVQLENTALHLQNQQLQQRLERLEKLILNQESN
jgi:hypothetical protein